MNKVEYDYGSSFLSTYFDKGPAAARIQLTEKIGNDALDLCKTLSDDDLIDLMNYICFTVVERHIVSGVKTAWELSTIAQHIENINKEMCKSKGAKSSE